MLRDGGVRADAVGGHEVDEVVLRQQRRRRGGALVQRQGAGHKGGAHLQVWQLPALPPRVRVHVQEVALQHQQAGGREHLVTHGHAHLGGSAQRGARAARQEVARYELVHAPVRAVRKVGLHRGFQRVDGRVRLVVRRALQRRLVPAVVQQARGVPTPRRLPAVHAHQAAQVDGVVKLLRLGARVADVPLRVQVLRHLGGGVGRHAQQARRRRRKVHRVQRRGLGARGGPAIHRQHRRHAHLHRALKQRQRRQVVIQAAALPTKHYRAAAATSRPATTPSCDLIILPGGGCRGSSIGGSHRGRRRAAARARRRVHQPQVPERLRLKRRNVQVALHHKPEGGELAGAIRQHAARQVIKPCAQAHRLQPREGSAQPQVQLRARLHCIRQPPVRHAQRRQRALQLGGRGG